MKSKNKLIRLVKVENSIATIFERLIKLDIESKINSSEYLKNLTILSDLLKIENKYLDAVYDYINYYDKNFGNSPLRYVVSEYGTNNYFVNSFSEHVFQDNIFCDEEEYCYNNRYTKFLKENFESKLIDDSIDELFSTNIASDVYQNYDNSNISVIYDDLDNDYCYDDKSNNTSDELLLEEHSERDIEIVEYTRSEGNLIYQRISNGLISIKYNQLLEEAKEKNKNNEVDLIDTCVTRDKLLFVVIQCDKKISELKKDNSNDNKELIEELTYYKYSNIFICSLLTKDYLFSDNNYLLRDYLGFLVRDKHYINELYKNYDDMKIDDIVYDICYNMDTFSDLEFRDNYDNSLMEAITFSFTLKSRLQLLADKEDIKDYCKKIEEDIFMGGYYINSLEYHSIFADYIKKTLNSVLCNIDNNTYKKII